MEADKSQRVKRSMKTPIRFQPWQEGDSHFPMAKRNQKSKLKKDQKKYREKRMEKEDTAKADTAPNETEGPDVAKQAKSKKIKEKIPENDKNKGKKHAKK